MLLVTIDEEQMKSFDLSWGISRFLINLAPLNGKRPLGWAVGIAVYYPSGVTMWVPTGDEFCQRPAGLQPQAGM